jgi:fibronectin-binding autotransporter adhesin
MKRQTGSNPKIAAAISVAALQLLFTSPLAAGTHTWTGAINGYWATAGNWQEGTIPTAFEQNIVLVFPAGATRTVTTNNLFTLNVNAVNISGNNYVLRGAGAGLAFNLTFGPNILCSGANAIMDMPLTFHYPAQGVSVSSGASLTLAEPITGGGGFTKYGTGILTLAGGSPNTFADTLRVYDGTLQLNQTGGVAVPGALEIGTTNIATTATVRLLANGQIASTAPVTIDPNAALWLDGHANTIGSLTMNGGEVITDAGLLTVAGDITAATEINHPTISGRVAISGTRNVMVNSGRLIVSARVMDGGIGPDVAGIIKAGAGDLRLASSNSFSGPLTVTAGGVTAQHANAFGSSAAGTTVNDGASLVLAFPGVVANEGLTLAGAGVENLGVLQAFGFQAAWNGNVTLVSDAVISVQQVAGTFTLGGAISGAGGLTKIGPAKLILSGGSANTFAGVTRAQEGTLRLAKSNGLRAIRDVEVGKTNVATSALLELGANEQVDNAARVAVYRGCELYLDAYTESVGGLLLVAGKVNSGFGLLHLLGDVNGITEYTYDWILGWEIPHAPVIEGQLSLGGATRNFYVGSAKTNYEGDFELDCVLSDGAGTGGLRKQGPGSLRLNRANTYNGTTFVEEGRVYVNHNGAFGSPAQGTVVSTGASIALVNAPGLTISAEPLVLNGHGQFGFGALLSDYGSSAWNGPITVASDATIGILNESSFFSIQSAIGGTGRLTKSGTGVLTLGGAAPNTFTGGFHASQGFTFLSKPAGATAIRGQLIVGTTNDVTAAVILLTANQIHDSTEVIINRSGTLNINEASDEIGSLVLKDGTVEGTSGVLILGGNLSAMKSDGFPSGQSIVACNLSLGGVTRVFDVDFFTTLQVSRDIQDGGAAAGITKTGYGFLKFDNNSTSFNGPMTVQGGELYLIGNATVGSTAAGTILEPDGGLLLSGARIGVEPLTVAAGITHGSWDISFTGSTNVWMGPVTLNRNTIFFGQVSGTMLHLGGAISGSAGFTYSGGTHMALLGTDHNTFAGAVHVEDGTLLLGKTNRVAVSGPLIVGTTNGSVNEGFARLLNSHQIADDVTVTVLNSGLLDLNGTSDVIGGLDLNGGEVETDAGQLRLTDDVSARGGCSIKGKLSLGDYARTFTVEDFGNLNIFASISSTDSGAGITKEGRGTLWLYGTNTFDGSFNIMQGNVAAQNKHVFGSALGGTFVTNYCELQLGPAVNVDAEPLRLARGTLSGSLNHTNSWNGPIVSDDFSEVTLRGTNAWFNLGGVISGGGNVHLRGYGTVMLSGNQPNTFTGSLRANCATVILNKTNGVAVSGDLMIGDSIGQGDLTTIALRPGQIAATSSVFLRQWADWQPYDSTLDLNNFNTAIGSLSGGGYVKVGNAILTVGGNNSNSIYGGVISGNAQTNVVKVGTGVFTLAGTNTYTGRTLVNGGRLLINGQVAGFVFANPGGTVGGRGEVYGIIGNGGTIEPGATGDAPSYGKLRAGSLNFSGGGTYRCEIGGNSPGYNADLLDDGGQLALNDATLEVQQLIASSPGNQFTVIKMTPNALVTGQFAGLPEGAVLNAGSGRTFSITYAGGASGKDVVLTQLTAPSAATFGGITKLDDGAIQLGGSGSPGLAYDIFAATNLTGAPWIKLGSVTADGNGALAFIDNDAPSFAMRFYRFVLP